MAAADYNSAEITKSTVAPKQRLKNNELYGTVTVLKFSYDTVAAGFGTNSIADRLYIGKLPKNSRVIGGRVSFGAMGTSATLSIGTDSVTYATTQPVQGAGTGAEFASAIDVSAAGVAELVNFASTVEAAVSPDTAGVSAGYGYENKLGEVAVFLLTAGATYATGKRIEGTILFVANGV